MQSDVTKASATSVQTHTLPELEHLDGAALSHLYAQGRVTSLKALDGHPLGRMLAVRGLSSTPVGDWLREFSRSSAFVWGGKSFKAADSKHGEGSNRVHLGGRHQMFPFHTLVSESVVDGKPTIVLDYDLPDNPAVIRKIHDEIREVSPGLYLGPAMWKTTGAPVHVLWFALDTRQQAIAIGHK